MLRPIPPEVDGKYAGLKEAGPQINAYAICHSCGSRAGYHDRAHKGANYINLTYHPKVKEPVGQLPDYIPTLGFQGGECVLAGKDHVTLYDKDANSLLLSWVDETKEPQD